MNPIVYSRHTRVFRRTLIQRSNVPDLPAPQTTNDTFQHTVPKVNDIKDRKRQGPAVGTTPPRNMGSSSPAPTSHEEHRPLRRHVPGHPSGHPTVGAGTSPRKPPAPSATGAIPSTQGLGRHPRQDPALRAVDAGAHGSEAGCPRCTARGSNRTGSWTPGRRKRWPCGSDRVRGARGGSDGDRRRRFLISWPAQHVGLCLQIPPLEELGTLLVLAWRHLPS